MIAMRTIYLLMTCLMSGIVAAGQATASADLQVTRHDCREPGEGIFSALAASARDQAATYFADMGFVLEKQDVARKVEVFCTRDSARRALAAEFHTTEIDIPATFSGTVQNATLFIVSREIYKENFIQLYGAERWEDKEYEKLMTHEMIHSGHAIVAKRLFGSEDGMGPQWLFEGLAIEASGQLPVSEAELNKLTIDDFNEFLRKAEKGDLKAPIYVQYAKFYRYVRRCVSSKWIVENAGQPDVIERMRKALQACQPTERSNWLRGAHREGAGVGGTSVTARRTREAHSRLPAEP